MKKIVNVVDVEKAVKLINVRLVDLASNLGSESALYQSYLSQLGRMSPNIPGLLRTNKNGVYQISRSKSTLKKLGEAGNEKTLSRVMKSKTLGQIKASARASISRERGLKKREVADNDIIDHIKYTDEWHRYIQDNLQVIYASENLRSFVHERGVKTYNELEELKEQIETAKRVMNTAPEELTQHNLTDF